METIKRDRRNRLYMSGDINRGDVRGFLEEGLEGNHKILHSSNKGRISDELVNIFFRISQF
jgi:hypothetical protein